MMDGELASLRGTWNILPTPFDEAAELDLSSLEVLVEFVLATGVDGITILGVLGEAAKLTDDERTLVLEATLARVAGRVPVCVGISSPSTARSIAYARRAGAAGAHSVLLSPPPLGRPNDGAVRRHYLEVAASVHLPIVIQDHPASSGVWLSVEVLTSLAGESRSLSVIKLEDPPTLSKIALLLGADPSIRILGGLGGEMCLEELRAGAVGVMTGFAYPEILVDVLHRQLAGDVAGAAEEFYRYLPLIRLENQPLINLALRKYLYQRRGAIRFATVRQPGPLPDPAMIDELEHLLGHLGLSDPSLR